MVKVGDARLRVVLVAAALAFSVSGCAAKKYYSAAKEEADKNPHAAIEYLALCLKEKPEHEEAKALFADLAKTIAKQHEDKVADLERNGKFEDAIAQCDRVQSTIEFSRQIPGAPDIFYDNDTRPRLADKAADKFYEQGISFEKQNNPIKALICFRRAEGYKPGYKDANERYQKNKKAAMLTVEFHPFAAKGEQGSQVASAIADKFKATLIGKKMELLEICDPGNPEAKAVLEGSVEAKYRDTGWSNEGRSNTVEIQEEVGKDARGLPVFQTIRVSASWVYHKRKTSLGFGLTYSIKMKEGGQVRSSGSDSQSSGDEKEYVSDFSGDQRAVPLLLPPKEMPQIDEFDMLIGKTAPKSIETLARKVFGDFKAK